MLATHTVDPVDFLRVALPLAARMIHPARGRQPLTPRQLEVSNYLAAYIDVNSYAPSLKEIAEDFGFASLATVVEHLRNLAHPHHVHMNGTEIFTFTLREVPGIIDRTLLNAARRADDVDYFFLHQANKFILNHLVKKIKLPSEKCPFSIGSYGNTNGASPAVTACHAVADVNRDRELLAMFVGFGVGFSWGGALVRLRPGTVFPIEQSQWMEKIEENR